MGVALKLCFRINPLFLIYIFFTTVQSYPLMPVSILEADLLKPENETLHSMEFLEEYADVFKLFGLILRSEGKRVYACVKTEADESNKW